ncbi:MAG: alkaline phosphatase [Candidatus Hodarchaeales archaeon]|jgi:alkaline phosphatase
MEVKVVTNGHLYRMIILITIISISFFPLNESSGKTEEFGLEKQGVNGRSVILMIGDGLGKEQVKLAKWVEVGKDGSLNMEQLPINLDITTYSSNDQITDSAAAATALSTGQKTNNGMIALSPASERLETILELAKNKLKKSTGIISTARLTHATPASFISHEVSRDNEYEIARQIVEEQNVDVLLGGGRARFSLHSTTLKEKGYTTVENKTALEDVQSGKVIGLFSSEHMTSERNRDREEDPSLAEMTSKAIEILSQDPNGFFLMVEGAQIDWAGHDNDGIDNALETIEFDKAVAVARNYAELDGNTLLIVTADHETGGLSVISEDMDDPLPSSSNSDEINEELRVNRTEDVYFLWSTTSHTGQNVPFYGYGDTLADYENATIIDNTDVFNIMKNYYYRDTSIPEITISSPSNDTYFSTKVWLNISVNRFPSWISYSLDGKNNQTITSNVLLKSLSETSHYIVVYANDSLGNMGVSKTVWFTVEILTTTTESSNVSSTIGLSMFTLMLALPVSLLLNRKNRKR